MIQDDVAHLLQNTNIASEPKSVVGRGSGVGFGFITDEEGLINGVKVPKHKRVNVARLAEGIVEIGFILSDEASRMLNRGEGATIRYFIRNLERIPHVYNVIVGAMVPAPTVIMRTEFRVSLLPFERREFEEVIPSNPFFDPRDIFLTARAVVQQAYISLNERGINTRVAGEASQETIQQLSPGIDFTLLGDGRIPAGYHGANLVYIEFPPSDFTGLTYVNPTPETLEPLFKPPISTFRHLIGGELRVFAELKNQLDVTSKNVNFNFRIVSPANHEERYDNDFRVEPYAVPSIPGITFDLNAEGGGIIRPRYTFPQGIDRNYIIAMTIGVSPRNTDRSVESDLSEAFVRQLVIRREVGRTFTLSVSTPYTGVLDFYDENLRIVRLPRGLIVNQFQSFQDLFLYTRVQETQTTGQMHLHTVYIGGDSRSFNHSMIRSIEMELLLSFLGDTGRTVVTSYLSVYNRMRHGDFPNSVFPYYPLLATSIFGASIPPLRINNLDPAPPGANIGLTD